MTSQNGTPATATGSLEPMIVTNGASGLLERAPANGAATGASGKRAKSQDAPAPKAVQRGRWSLKNKATVLAIALSTIPTIIVGGIATSIASSQISKSVVEQQQQLASTVNLQMQDFVTGRLRDAAAIASNPLVTDSTFREQSSPQAVLDFFNGYLERDPSYSGVTVIQPDGGFTYLDADETIPLITSPDLIEPAQNADSKFFAERNIPYYLAVRDTLQPFVAPIRISTSSGKSSFYLAVPAFADITDRFTAIVYSRTVADDLSALINQRVESIRQANQQVGQDLESALQFSVMDHATAYFETTEAGQDKEILSTRISQTGDTVTIDGNTFQPGGSIVKKENRVFISNVEESIGAEMQAIFPKYDELRDSGTTITVTDTSTRTNEPYLVTYTPIPQVGGLGNNWGVLVYQPTAEVFAARRALIWTLLGGTALTALLVGALAAYLSNRATKPIIEATRAVTKLGKGRFDTRLKVKGDDELAVLNSNINIMADQLEYQLAYIEESAQQQGLFQAQAAIAQQQRQQREDMQQELMRLIQSVEGASEGDLTVRADLSTGEIGIVADVFNSIVENLRKIVVQVKQATTQVNSSIGNNQTSIRQLADDALAQVDDISHTLTSMQQMSASIQRVAANAQQAATVAKNASSTAQQGTQAMDETVSSIMGLRATVATTTKKVKQLGEASQQISQVVGLINEIALKTNLLAINASIEAAHAGEEGQGFAVVAGEVGQLAEQSARATKEIERIVKDIQHGTRDVVEAMDLSTSQVVEGTAKLNETKASLAQILSVSEEIDQLVQSISEATVSQADTSQTVTELMQQITVSSQRTSDFSKAVDGALQGTVNVAQALEETIDKFKVNSESDELRG